jgi:hypothetical protein
MLLKASYTFNRAKNIIEYWRIFTWQNVARITMAIPNYSIPGTIFSKSDFLESSK